MAEKSESWFQQAAEKMVRENKTLPQVASELEIPITSREAGNIEKRKSFQKILWIARHAYFQELGNQPGRNKTEAIGRAMLCVQKLMDGENWKEALEGILKLAKIEGWVGSDQNINVFAGLTAKDIEEAKKKLKDFGGPGDTTSAGSRPLLPN